MNVWDMWNLELYEPNHWVDIILDRNQAHLSMLLHKQNNLWYVNSVCLNTSNYVQAYKLAVQMFPNAQFRAKY